MRSIRFTILEEEESLKPKSEEELDGKQIVSSQWDLDVSAAQEAKAKVTGNKTRPSSKADFGKGLVPAGDVPIFFNPIHYGNPLSSSALYEPGILLLA